jgi:hypothetical protein
VQAYASGAACHTSCIVQRMLLTSSDPAFRESLRLLVQTLTAFGTKGRSDAAHAAKIADLQHQLFLHMQEGDPLCSEQLVRLIELPYGSETAATASEWALSSAAG